MAHDVTLPDGFVVSDDKARLDLDLIHRYLAEESYWAAGRSRAIVERTIAGSLCVGAYGPDGAQLGFARVITDRALFAWMADVFVLPGARAAARARDGRGAARPSRPRRRAALDARHLGCERAL